MRSDELWHSLICVEQKKIDLVNFDLKNELLVIFVRFFGFVWGRGFKGGFNSRNFFRNILKYLD